VKYPLRILRYLPTGRRLPPRCSSCGSRCFGGWTNQDADQKIRHWCLRPGCTADSNLEGPS